MINQHDARIIRTMFLRELQNLLGRTPKPAYLSLKQALEDTITENNCDLVYNPDEDFYCIVRKSKPEPKDKPDGVIMVEPNAAQMYRRATKDDIGQQVYFSDYDPSDENKIPDWPVSELIDVCSDSAFPYHVRRGKHWAPYVFAFVAVPWAPEPETEPQPEQPAWEPKPGDLVKVTKPSESIADDPGWPASMDYLDGQVVQLIDTKDRKFPLGVAANGGPNGHWCLWPAWLSPATAPAAEPEPTPGEPEPSQAPADQVTVEPMPEQSQAELDATIWVVGGKTWRLATEADIGKQVVCSQLFQSPLFCVGSRTPLKQVKVGHDTERFCRVNGGPFGCWWKYAWVQDDTIGQVQTELPPEEPDDTETPEPAEQPEPVTSDLPGHYELGDQDVITAGDRFMKADEWNNLVGPSIGMTVEAAKARYGHDYRFFRPNPVPVPMADPAHCDGHVCDLAEPTKVTCPPDSCDLDTGTREMPKPEPLNPFPLFPVGSKVKVVKPTNEDDLAFDHCCWVDYLDSFVGHVFTVESWDELMGHYTLAESEPSGFRFHELWLDAVAEPVEPEPVGMSESDRQKYGYLPPGEFKYLTDDSDVIQEDDWVNSKSNGMGLDGSGWIPASTTLAGKLLSQVKDSLLLSQVKDSLLVARQADPAEPVEPEPVAEPEPEEPEWIEPGPEHVGQVVEVQMQTKPIPGQWKRRTLLAVLSKGDAANYTQGLRFVTQNSTLDSGMNGDDPVNVKPGLGILYGSARVRKAAQ